MLPFSEFPFCHICSVKFAFLKRVAHCRNCGVCICKDCTTYWPSIMIPDTYNFKRESSVNVCKSCDWLCHEFRQALLEGDYDRSLALHSTGNVNVYTPFANVKGELFHPVHCVSWAGILIYFSFWSTTWFFQLPRQSLSYHHIQRKIVVTYGIRECQRADC